jgi:hypothetical protein
MSVLYGNEVAMKSVDARSASPSASHYPHFFHKALLPAASPAW